MEPRYTVSLLTAETGRRTKGGVLTVTGPSRNEREFTANIKGMGVPILLDDLAAWTPPPPDDPAGEPSWELPLLPTPEHAKLLGRLRAGPRFDAWARGHAGVFPLQGDMNETTNKALFAQKSGIAVWKGRSFNQYDPHGNEPAGFGNYKSILEFVHGKRLASHSRSAGRFAAEYLRDPATNPINACRLVFRDVTNYTDSRTVIAALAPPRVALVNSAPYLVFPNQSPLDQSYVLGVLNSLPFDWQARRFIETHLNFFVLNLLCLPPEDRVDHSAIAERAARLSCVDERFREFATAMETGSGPLTNEERGRLRAEIDALVAIGYGLDAVALETVFADFTPNAVPEAYRALVREKFTEFSAQPAKVRA